VHGGEVDTLEAVDRTISRLCTIADRLTDMSGGGERDFDPDDVRDASSGDDDDDDARTDLFLGGGDGDALVILPFPSVRDRHIEDADVEHMAAARELSEAMGCDVYVAMDALACSGNDPDRAAERILSGVYTVTNPSDTSTSHEAVPQRTPEPRPDDQSDADQSGFSDPDDEVAPATPAASATTSASSTSTSASPSGRCPVCIDDFSHATMACVLCCGHKLCEACIHGIAAASGPRRQGGKKCVIGNVFKMPMHIRCPVCRKHGNLYTKLYE
jgi:hypothetical protein